MSRELIPLNTTVTLPEFLKAVRMGMRDLFLVLRTPVSGFAEATRKKLAIEIAEMSGGVSRVLVNKGNNYFNIFRNCLVKYHDDGDIQFFFYDIVKDPAILVAAVETLFEALGPGITCEDQGIPFRNADKLLSLARGKYRSRKDRLFQLWSLDDTIWLLQYEVVPLRQFCLMVMIRAGTPATAN